MVTQWLPCMGTFPSTFPGNDMLRSSGLGVRLRITIQKNLNYRCPVGGYEPGDRSVVRCAGYLITTSPIFLMIHSPLITGSLGRHLGRGTLERFPRGEALLCWLWVDSRTKTVSLAYVEHNTNIASVLGERRAMETSQYN